MQNILDKMAKIKAIQKAKKTRKLGRVELNKLQNIKDRFIAFHETGRESVRVAGPAFSEAMDAVGIWGAEVDDIRTLMDEVDDFYTEAQELLGPGQVPQELEDIFQSMIDLVESADNAQSAYEKMEAAYMNISQADEFLTGL